MCRLAAANKLLQKRERLMERNGGTHLSAWVGECARIQGFYVSLDLMTMFVYVGAAYCRPISIAEILPECRI
jgi:hypothetical protein